jgi:hypothetical protein
MPPDDLMADALDEDEYHEDQRRQRDARDENLAKTRAPKQLASWPPLLTHHEVSTVQEPRGTHLGYSHHRTPASRDEPADSASYVEWPSDHRGFAEPAK